MDIKKIVDKLYREERAEAKPPRRIPANANSRDTVNFDALNRNIALQAENFLSTILPNGKHRGHEYIVANPNRVDKNIGSFSININTGQWGDFATGDQGKDFISLYAFVNGIGNVEAARELLETWKIN